MFFVYQLSERHVICLLSGHSHGLRWPSDGAAKTQVFHFEWGLAKNPAVGLRQNVENDSTFGETQPYVTLQWPIM